MPDLTAFLEARAALDEHLSRLGGQGSSKPWLHRHRRVLVSAGKVGGSIAILLAAVALLPEAWSDKPRTPGPAVAVSEGSLMPAPTAERKRDRAFFGTGASGPHSLPPDTKKVASGVEGSARPSRGDTSKPSPATPSPVLVIARLAEPNPPGRYDFDQESATTGAIGPSKPVAQPIILGARTAQTGTGTLQARPTDPSASPPKVTAARRRPKTTKEVAPVAVKRVRSGVAELLAWVMPVHARPTR
jgi:hypothetical protein